jgi:hypothetical protein
MSKLWKSLLDFRANPASHQTKPARLEPTANRHHSVGPALVPDDHAPNNCEEYVPNIKSGDGLANLVELQQNMIAALQTEMCDMATDMSEKDKTIMELKLEIADRSRNFRAS